MILRSAALAVLLTLSAPSAHAQFESRLYEGLDFRMVGPSRGGRATAVTGHAAQPGTYYFGSTGGGVWKTTDYGQSWRNVSDGFFETASIGAVDVADADPDVVYVGTGSDGLRSNVIVGRGVYRSADGGETWSFVGLRETGQIGAVVVHPADPEVVYVAALGSPFGPNPERGVYRTRDAGATWEHLFSVSDSTGAIDLELHPADPDVIYAAFWRGERKPWTIISGDDEEDGLYRSTDGGATWTKLEDGLPGGLVGKIDLAVSPADPERVYALVEARPEDEGLYRSDDRGDTWRLTSNEGYLMTRPFYYTNVDADPTDADVVYVNNLAFWKSTDGGSAWQRVSTPHGDNHDLWIDPNDPQVMIQANDGGVNVTRDGGRTWSTQHNQPTAELYQVHVDDRFPYWLYAGQQDNSTIAVPSLPPDYRPGGAPAYWEAIGGCETGPVVPKPGDPDIVYANCKGRFGVYDRRTGQERQYYVGAVNLYGTNPKDLPYRFQRVVPVEVSPHDPDVVYHGSQYVHRTADGGQTWERISPDLTAFRPERQVISGGPITRDITGEEHYSTLYVIEESPLEPGVVWTGSNDGPVHVTRDGGRTWTDVTPPDMPPEGRIQNIDPSPHRPGKAYVAGYRYLLDDWAPYAYRTDDYGRTWTRLTDGANGIPADYPVRVVREDPDREGLLYAGTEFGLFVSFDDGASWQPFQLDLPATPVTDLRVHRKDLIVATMGRSFWILDDLSPLHQLDDAVASADVHLFRPRDAYRMRYAAYRGEPTDPEYPPPGATIDYVLTGDAPGPLVLEILDAGGEVVRRFEGTPARAEAAEEQGMRAPRRPARRGDALAHTAGMHRFVWDLRREGPEAVDGVASGGRGPMVAPGTYRVRLTAGDRVLEQPLVVLADPRVAAAGVTQADMEAQEAFNLSVRDLITEARRTGARLRALQETVKDGPAREVLDGLEAELFTREGVSYPQPMLLDQIGYLYGMTTQADQRPGRDAYERRDALRAQLSDLQRRLR